MYKGRELLCTAVEVTSLTVFRINYVCGKYGVDLIRNINPLILVFLVNILCINKLTVGKLETTNIMITGNPLIMYRIYTCI